MSASKVRIWSIAEPGSLVASLFDGHGAPILDADYDPPPVELVASYVERPAPGHWPEGPMLTRDRLTGRSGANLL